MFVSYLFSFGFLVFVLVPSRRRGLVLPAAQMCFLSGTAERPAKTRQVFWRVGVRESTDNTAG